MNSIFYGTQAVMGIPGVDGLRTQTNHVTETYDVLVRGLHSQVIVTCNLTDLGSFIHQECQRPHPCHACCAGNLVAAFAREKLRLAI